MNQQTIIRAFDVLPRDEQAELLEQLRATYEAGDTRLSIEEVEVLDERMAEYRRDPGSAFDAEEVCDEMVRLAREG